MTSKKIEIASRLEEEGKFSMTEDPSAVSDGRQSKFLGNRSTVSDENDVFFRDFDVEDAWTELHHLEGCFKVALDDQQQKDIGVQLGTNVSTEFPWKQVKCKIVREYLPDEPFIMKDEHETLLQSPHSSQQQIEPLERFPDMKPDDMILIGYAPMLSEDEDIFLVFTSLDSARSASNIIRTIEAYQHWLLNRAMMKKGGRWISQGSDAYVDSGRAQEQKAIVDVEIQSVYPIKHSNARFQHRYSDTVRDGYVELVPDDKKFENVFRRRVDVAIQSAPARVDLAQQTDPTFPSNAWSQYLYEINPDDEGLDRSDDELDEEAKKRKQKSNKVPSRPASAANAPEVETPEPPKPPPEMSSHMNELLETLEFNQVDMYRNDYPLISAQRISKYSVPFLKEILCFADISRSIDRYVCGVDWYPTLSGLLVASYTFSTMASTVNGDSNIDAVKRAVIEPNPVLMWSFDDSLRHTFEFETPREVTTLSFCPYDENILIGGTMNGQIIIWDLQNRIARDEETDKVLTAAQIRYRNVMRQYLSWMKMPNESVVFRPAAISDLKFSHGGPVTGIKWLSRNHYITATGQARESEKTTHRYFVTCSMNGTVAFWNLDATVDRKRSVSSASKTVHEQLMQDVSIYKKFDRIFRPQYIIEHKEPLTSILCNHAKFKYSTEDRVRIKVDAVTGQPFEQNMTVSTMTGHIHKIDWEGFDFVPSTEVNKETIQSPVEFAPVHDGPVTEVRRNPFCDTIYASAGKNVLAIWKEGCTWTPIYWRKRPAAITRMEWSLDRPGLLFLCRNDGTFEAWDLLARSDDASLMDQLSGGMITALSEHYPMADKMIGIGDYNSSFRVLVLPPAFKIKLPMEAERLTNIIDREEIRKQRIKEWENSWLAKNADILQAKKQQAEQALQELERLKKEAQHLEEQRSKRDAEEARKTQLKEKKKFVYDLPERLEKKWDDMNLRRLVKLLMSRRLVDHAKLSQQTAMEKARLAYEQSKKRAIKKSFKTIDEDVAAIRARLLPLVVENKERMEMATESGHTIVAEAANYADIEAQADKFVSENPVTGDVTFSEFLERGRQRRLVINKSLGATTERQHWYNNLKHNRLLGNLDFGYKGFVQKVDDKQQDKDVGEPSTTEDYSSMEE